MIWLRVDRAASSCPPALSPEGPGVDAWRDADGVLVAYATRRGAEHRIDVPGVARFRFTTREPEIVAWPEPGVRDGFVHDHYYRAILPLALQARGYQVLHASAVERDGVVYALAARKESGKSTLAFALGERGYAPWADDAVVFEAGGEGVDALSLPFDLRLREAPAALFGRPRVVPVSRRGRPETEPVEMGRATLAGILVLERVAGPEAPESYSVERLDAGAALLAVLAHAYCFELEDAERKRRMMDQFLALVARVPVHRLRYRSGLDRLPALVAGLDAVLAGLAARPA